MPQPDRVPGQLRLALTPAEAAQALRCSRGFFDKHTSDRAAVGSARSIEVGSNRRVEDWLSKNAARTIDGPR